MHTRKSSEEGHWHVHEIYLEAEQRNHSARKMDNDTAIVSLDGSLLDKLFCHCILVASDSSINKLFCHCVPVVSDSSIFHYYVYRSPASALFG